MDLILAATDSRPHGGLVSAPVETYPAIEARAQEEEATIYWADEVGVAPMSNRHAAMRPKGSARP
jgi:hypothetical protein